MVRPKDRPRDRKCRFICSTNNTPVDIFGSSQTPLTNPAKRYSRSTTCKGETASNMELDESTSVGTMELGKSLPIEIAEPQFLKPNIGVDPTLN